jgi:hypothetical protein
MECRDEFLGVLFVETVSGAETSVVNAYLELAFFGFW